MLQSPETVNVELALSVCSTRYPKFYEWFFGIVNYVLEEIGYEMAKEPHQFHSLRELVYKKLKKRNWKRYGWAFFYIIRDYILQSPYGKYTRIGICTCGFTVICSEIKHVPECKIDYLPF